VCALNDAGTFEELKELHEAIIKVKDDEKVPFVIMANKCVSDRFPLSLSRGWVWLSDPIFFFFFLFSFSFSFSFFLFFFFLFARRSQDLGSREIDDKTIKAFAESIKAPYFDSSAKVFGVFSSFLFFLNQISPFPLLVVKHQCH